MMAQVVMEQILIRDLPTGTNAALKFAPSGIVTRSRRRREILTDAVEREPRTLVDLLASDDGAGIDFEPGHLSSTARASDL